MLNLLQLLYRRQDFSPLPVIASGFAALTSALIGMGIGPGDEVIVPGYTYIASALAVTAVGAIPVIAGAAIIGVIYSFFVTRRVKK